MIYESAEPRNQFGQHLEINALAAPPGYSVAPQLAELLRGIESQLGLVEAGLFTPWAKRESDLDWDEIQSPTSNVAAFSIDDAQLNKATEVLFGQPLPFVAVLTPLLAPEAVVQNASHLTKYEFFETQAVYRQTDPKEIPTIEFLHWYQVRDLGAGGGSMPMSTVATALGGKLVFAQQVPADGTTTRAAPLVSFQDALRAQLGVSPLPGAPVGPPPLPGFPGPEDPLPTEPAPPPTIPAPPPTIPQGPQALNWAAPFFVGAAVFAGVVWLGGRKRGK